jgi:hypothetical protein
VSGLFGHNTDSTCIARSAPSLDVQCTGNNIFGQLGEGTRNTRFQFTSVSF